MSHSIRFLSFILMIFVFSSCSETNKLNKYNTAKQYVDEFPGRMMQQQVFHVNDTLSELSIRVLPSLIPNLKSNHLEVYSYMNLTYAVYTSMNKKDLLDTDSYKLSEILPFDHIEDGIAQLTVPIAMKQNSNYVVLVSLQDPINKNNYLKILRIFKSEGVAENYKILDENDEILWYPWIENGKKIKIQYRYTGAKSVHLSYFKPEFSPAKPPYAQIDQLEYTKAQVFENFEVSLDKGKSSVIQLPKEGVYKVHYKEDDLSGKTLTQFYDAYPSVSSDAQKVFALRYLNARKEFAMMLGDEPAHTLNEFWYFEDRTKERSQEMMTSYYARMLRANRIFTSYKEGWKTDRGMIFMIYGPPDHVYHESASEIWEYGSDAEYNDLRFEFQVLNTPLIDKEFVLERSDRFKNSWYRLLDHWRNE